MKRKLLISSLLVFVSFVAIVGWLVHLSRIPTRVTFAFAGYTNDLQGVRPGLYRIPDQSDHSMALFTLASHTSRSFWCSPERIQIKTSGGWIDDTNWVSYGSTSKVLEARVPHGVRLQFPVPAGSNSWRCSVELLDITYDTGWEAQPIAILRRVGLGFQKKDLSLWSEEIAK